MSMQRKDRKKLFIYLAAFAAVAGAAFIYKYFFDGNTDGFVRSATPTSATEVAQIQESKILPTTSISQSLGSEKTSIDVYICGQVRSPGVYTFVPGVILDDVISKAGGFTPDAAKDRVNLVYVITSNISVYVASGDAILITSSKRFFNHFTAIISIKPCQSFSNTFEQYAASMAPFW